MLIYRDPGSFVDWRTHTGVQRRFPDDQLLPSRVLMLATIVMWGSFLGLGTRSAAA